MRFDNNEEVYDFGKVLIHYLRKYMQQHEIPNDSCVNEVIWRTLAKMDTIELLDRAGNVVANLEDGYYENTRVKSLEV